jgi:hypothetical protein
MLAKASRILFVAFCAIGAAGSAHAVQVRLVADRPAGASTSSGVGNGAAAAAVALSEITSAIAREHASTYDRARAVYEWIAGNLAYDVHGYLTDSFGDMSAEATFARRTAVCEGFVNLFVRMANDVGVQAQKVEGYAKGFDHTPGTKTKKPNHAWVAFRDGRAWKLADPTWGAGHIENLEFAPSFNWWYFDVDPAALALSHFPKEKRWHLVRRAPSRSVFERMAAVPRALLEVGLAPAALQAAADTRDHPGFPLVGVVPGVRLLAAPLTARLEAGTPERFEIVWPDADDVVISNGERWLTMTRADDRYTLDIVPAAGPLMIAGRSPGSTEYRTLLYYEVR